MHTEATTEIIVVTIKMQAPSFFNSKKLARQADIVNEINEKHISYEEFLRKTAYKDAPMKIDESFFNDSDMKSTYYLVVVYDKTSRTPLLSSRYYFDKAIISKAVNSTSCENVNMDQYKEGELFLADRLSGNTENPIYQKNRDYIFSLFYSEVLTRNRNSSLILMARKEKEDRLLNKYNRLGFETIGSKMHNGKDHWIVILDLKKAQYIVSKT